MFGGFYSLGFFAQDPPHLAVDPNCVIVVSTAASWTMLLSLDMTPTSKNKLCY